MTIFTRLLFIVLLISSGRSEAKVIQILHTNDLHAALNIAGTVILRRSRTGQPRGALCGMGICHECRAEIDGVLHQRTCQVPCVDGMRIITNA